MPRSLRPTAVAGLAASALLLAGCGSTGEAGDDGRQAVASFYPLAWATELVAGEGWDVTNLTKPGQEAHHLALDIRQTAALEDAELVVVHSGFQAAVDSAVTNLEVEHLVDVGEVVELRPSESGHDHDHEGETEAGHDDDLDPHFWLDPLLMADLADAVAAELAEADPDSEEVFVANAADLRADLAALDEEYATGLADCARDVAVVSHHAFGYLERYGVRFEAIAGLTPDAEPTAADLAHLQEEIREHGVTTVFHERLSTSKMADSLAGDLGVETAVLDPLEGLTDQTADEDYLSLMRANLAALKKANDCS